MKAGRPRKHSVDDLADCLGRHGFTTGQFARRARETLDISRATFFRLLKAGQESYRFRQAWDGTWKLIGEKAEPKPEPEPVSKSQNGLEGVPRDLPW